MIIAGDVSNDDHLKITSYLSNKWGLTSTVDSDGDGFTDAVETGKETSPIDSSDKPSDLPAVLADAQLWFDAANVDGEGNASLDNGATVSEWKDLSGNNNTGNTGSEPKIDFSEGVKFDGLDDYVYINHSSSMKLTNYSIILVMKPDGALNETWKGIIGKPGRNNNSGYIALFIFIINLKLVIMRVFIPLIHTVTNSGAVDSPHNSISLNQDNLVQIEHTGSLARDYVNGVSIVETASQAQVAVDGTTYIARSLDGGSSNYFKGSIKEVLVFNRALTDQERSNINYYLSNKWGLTETVDSDGDGIVDEHDIDPVDPDKWVEIPFLRQSEEDAHTPIDGLALWLDATNINGNNNSGLNRSSSVSQWKDLSGNQYHPIGPDNKRWKHLQLRRRGF